MNMAISFIRILLIFSFISMVTLARASAGPGGKLKPLAMQAKDFARQKGFNTSTCFLLDLSISSGRNRFFVFDMDKDSIVDKGLVTHGHCNNVIQRVVKFSNKPGCGCSSSGRYKVGKKYHGNFGTAYKLVGLDNTNSNAEKRAVVMHSHSCVPDTECYPQEICRSEGCTTVSPAFLKRLEAVIARSEKPVLMWVFQ
jgi:hypothetical protein